MAVGDIYLVRPNPVAIFGDTLDLLQSADILLGVQEGPVSDRGKPMPGKVEVGSVHLRAPVHAVKAQAAAGFSAMTLANNHIMDYGEAALFHTMDLLRENGIGFTGAGRSVEEARKPLILERNGTRVAMLGYTSVFPVIGYAATNTRPGVATVRVTTSYRAPHNVPYQPGTPAITITTPDQQDMDTMLTDIQRAREAADIVIVQFHWGVAGYAHVLGYMKVMGRAAIDAGADLVVGNHAHLPLGLELYRNKLICYSLNHFAFDLRMSEHRLYDTLILKCLIRDRRLHAHALIPIEIDETSLDLAVAGGRRRAAMQASLEDLSREFGTDFSARGDALVPKGPRTDTPVPLGMPDVLMDPAPSQIHKRLARY
jgi:poly-gamma-glutamate capsule biosynthesis protein CapA/YwtB (metallophosphatase superfamily)